MPFFHLLSDEPSGQHDNDGVPGDSSLSCSVAKTHGSAFSIDKSGDERTG